MERAEFITKKDSPMKDILRRDIGGGGHKVVQLFRVINREGAKSRVNTWVPTFACVEKEVTCALWNCENATLRNSIILMGVYSTVVDLLNMSIYLSEKGFGAKFFIVG